MEKIVLGDGDVVSTGGSIFSMSPTFKKQELLTRLSNAANGNHEGNKHIGSWIDTNGVHCKVLLEKGGGWKSGRVRVTLEFTPDPPKNTNPPSPLDDLRT
ncbi:KGK domain-containing protein [Calothrix sp. 336/3]|uniref:KGK domain-containing protein n=1 Tax=Calothrix sp. 336/3 TaxID=1337936 RepID=UPI0004E3B742|nr:KGK domain-containing protein [Calothrix sp. 336/3]AKG21800.1 hypothetical protein IJ00_11505 [Calothrix sp. 336/3]